MREFKQRIAEEAVQLLAKLLVLVVATSTVYLLGMITEQRAKQPTLDRLRRENRDLEWAVDYFRSP